MRLRRAFFGLASVATTALLACGRPSHQSPLDVAVPDSVAEVIVSKGELRVVFPAETASTFAWRTGPAGVMYSWEATFAAIDGPRMLALRAFRDSTPKEFPSLAALVASGWRYHCGRQDGWTCGPTDGSVRAFVHGRRVVITLTNRRWIEDMVRIHEPTIRYRLTTPAGSREGTARIDVLPGALEPPDSAFRAHAAMVKRAVDSSLHWFRREIVVEQTHDSVVRVAVGDSVLVRASETACQGDVCAGGTLPLPATWHVADSSIATVKSPDIVPPPARIWGQFRYVRGVRPGRTTVIATDIVGAADSVPHRGVTARAASMTVIVTGAVRPPR